MNTGIYAAVSAQSAAEREMESIAANLANLQTTGFKRQGAATQSFDQVLNGRLNRQVQTRRTTDFSQGTLAHDGVHTNLGLRGEGFFAVETPSGEGYTRNGRFLIDDQGVLQTLEGFPVVWEQAGSPIDPRGAELVIDESGNVMQGDEPVGKLMLKNFSDTESFQSDSVGYLHLQPGGATEVQVQALVVQGSLERANVDPIVEMTQMIIVQRRLENAAQIMSQLNESYRRLNQSHA